MTTSKMRSQSASTVTSMDIWPKNVGRKKKKKQGNISNITIKGTLSRSKTVDLTFYFIFILFLFLFSIFLFLELRVRVSHIAQKKRIEGSQRITLYNIYNTC